MRMPALFLGHGSPMNALADNAWTRAWNGLGRTLPRPRAVLAVSAHWFLPGTRVTAMERPRTIHDFGGFPAELSAVRYPAPGDPALARRVRDVLSAGADPVAVGLDAEWGLDHGAWSVLAHLYPEADVPVVQLSLDETQPAPFFHGLGRRLRALRDEGVLVLGSGNLVHNLHAYGWGRRQVESYPWAVRFEAAAVAAIVADDVAALVDYATMGEDALLSVPTPEHFLPLSVVLGTRDPGEAVSFPVEGIDGGSVSMRAVLVGGT